MSVAKTKRQSRISSNGKEAKEERPLQLGENKIHIEPRNQQKIGFTLVGTMPLMVQEFGEKARLQMLLAQTQQKGTKKKECRSPVGEFLDSMYWLSDNKPKPSGKDEHGADKYDMRKVAAALRRGVFGVPAAGFREAMISACRNTDLTMTSIRQLIRVYGPEYPDYAVIKSPNPPTMDARICRLPGAAKTPMERFRGRWDDWKVDIEVAYDANCIGAEAVANLLSIAGAYVGICEARVERCSLGFGTFDIA